jgi:uncharacterized protein
MSHGGYPKADISIDGVPSARATVGVRATMTTASSSLPSLPSSSSSSSSVSACAHCAAQAAQPWRGLRQALRVPATLLTWLLLAVIAIYRGVLSPLFYALGARCRFTPSCSQYAAASLRKYGLFSGSAKAVYRLLRCHPFCRGGHDPP